VLRGDHKEIVCRLHGFGDPLLEGLAGSNAPAVTPDVMGLAAAVEGAGKLRLKAFNDAPLGAAVGYEDADLLLSQEFLVCW
jgi:hypothetical protein